MTNTPTTFFGWIIFLIQQYHGYYLQGLLTTLETSLAGTICGCFLGFLVGIIQATDIRAQDNMIKKILLGLKPFNAAIFIILLNTGAYMSETVRGGINSIDVGQIEGAKALGMGYVPMMIYIILPQTFKIIAPQIGNTFVANIKDTSVLNVIAVTELFYITKVAAGTYFRMFEAYTITALIYLTLTLLFNGLLKLIEKYMAGKESYEVLNPAAAK